MQSKSVRLLTYFGYVFAIAAYLFMGAVAAHPYDEAIIDQHAKLFYFLGTSPLYYLPQGIYWDIISIGSYFPDMVLHILGYQNVITTHLATKGFLLVSAFITAVYLQKIVEFITGDKRKGTLSFFIFIFNPLIFYSTAIYGSSIIIAVLFITIATYFIIKGEYLLAAIFYGLSIGTFIYPLLGIPIVVRYVMVKSGKSKMLAFLGISLAFGALGQGPIYLSYFLHGYGLSGLPVGLGYFSLTQIFPAYSVFDIFNLFPIFKLPYLNYLFYAAALLSSLIFFLIPSKKVDNARLFAFLGIQGVIFSSLAAGGVLMSFPASIVPFAILFAFSVERDSIYVPLIISFVALSLGMETINNYGLSIYFIDVNHSIAFHTIRVTAIETQLSGFFFGISILSMLPLYLFKHKRERRFNRGPEVAIAASISIVVILILLAASLVAPVAASVPLNNYLQDPISGSDAYVNEYVSNGTLFLNYTVPSLAFTPEKSYDKITMWLQEPEGYYTSSSYNFTSILPVKGNLSFPYEIGFPAIGASISLVSSSKDLVMNISNNTSFKLIEPTVSRYKSYYILSYQLDKMNGGKYTISINGTGGIGVFNSTSKYVNDGGKTTYGVEVDTVYSYYPVLSNGTVNGVMVLGGQLITIPFIAYNFHLHFVFHGFYEPATPPSLVINYLYENHSTVSLLEGAFAFVSVIALAILLFVLRKR